MQKANDPMILPLLLAITFPALLGQAHAGESAKKPASPEERAIAFLVREVPRWSRENRCFSCHNNGDAARALYHASRLGFAVPPKALEDTSQWLARPQEWDRNDGKAAVSDKGLARIQFAAALVEGFGAQRIQDRQALAHAAQLVADLQDKDGSWNVDANNNLGSPATYGAFWATHLAHRVLKTADKNRYKTSVARAEASMLHTPVTSVPDAAAVLLTLSDSQSEQANARKVACLDLIRRAQTASGGWGPYLKSAPEPFDTAVAILSLVRQTKGPDVKQQIEAGRAYLISCQLADGRWPETTRPSGAESYAQRISTTAWALLALLETRGKVANRHGSKLDSRRGQAPAIPSVCVAAQCNP
jgi:hypothetical protein